MIRDDDQETLDTFGVYNRSSVFSADAVNTEQYDFPLQELEETLQTFYREQDKYTRIVDGPVNDRVSEDLRRRREAARLGVELGLMEEDDSSRYTEEAPPIYRLTEDGVEHFFGDED